MEPRFFIKRVPQSLSTVLGSGLIVGSFYGLAPLYASQQGLSTEQVGLFMGSCIRSEEHTSALQSLMRISYAVFCLKKTKFSTRDSATSCSCCTTQAPPS